MNMKLLILSILVAFSLSGLAQKPGEPLPPWREGYLDLHHINTGRGDAALYILPDGTTFLFDAGEMPPDDSPRRTSPHPNASQPAYIWIARYLRKFMPPVSGGALDYAVISHFHNDHFGGYYEGAPVAKDGQYVCSGMTGVGDEIKIRTMIDRGYPDYNYPNQLKSLRKSYPNLPEVPAMGRGIVNYWKFLDYHVANSGMKVEGLKAGRDDQIVLVHNRKKYPSFRVVNVKSNGTIWTGQGQATFEHFVPYNDSVEIGENPLSNAIRIDYGDFRYYTGGDCPGVVDLGQPKWNDVGTAVAKAVGEVDVATLDHHGNRDAHNEFNVKTLRPRVWIGQSWSADHPGHDVLRRITSQYLYEGPRDLFATNMMEANRIVIGPLIDRSYKSTEGHIVVRVMPGGGEYFVIILNDENEKNEITAVFGPYQTKKK
jgi:beta-lactamase superfamily II metal-dependent hydrolase